MIDSEYPISDVAEYELALAALEAFFLHPLLQYLPIYYTKLSHEGIRTSFKRSHDTMSTNGALQMDIRLDSSDLLEGFKRIMTLELSALTSTTLEGRPAKCEVAIPLAAAAREG